MSRQFPIVRHEVYDRGTSSEKWTTIVTHEVSTSSVLKIEKVSREARRGFSTTDDPEQAFVWLNYELTPRRYVDSIAVAALRASIGRGQSLVLLVDRVKIQGLLRLLLWISTVGNWVALRTCHWSLTVKMIGDRQCRGRVR